ncbi:MAG: HAD family hydrolase [Anaerorhabdus sp.]
MQNIKLIVCDIDGTMISHNNNSISVKLKEAFEKIKEKNIEILIATGRHFSYIHPSLFNDLNPEYLVTINGACFNKNDGTIISSFPLKEEDVLKLTKFAKENGLGLGFKFPKEIVSYANYDIFYEGYIGRKRNNKNLPDIINNDTTNDYHIKESLPLGCFMIGDEKTIETLKPILPHLFISWSYPNGYDIFPFTTTKASSIEAFLKLKKLSWEDTMVFGDAENDISMIQKAKIGVAMGNAKDIVKKEADFITKSVDDDGIVFALEHFNII